ncbi:hypothetical protein [Clostridium baratii]|uniref:hypothetical protein n=1 Tax=Clostridium baratii TaxID=1561 RepID=UPI002916A984|nr:hypothetical protein [Clostridium baratii]
MMKKDIMMKKVSIISNKDLIKKRLMFSIAEDSYFLTYNIILILGGLNCINNKYLKDLNKIALLVTIIEKHRNIEVVNKILDDKKINFDDKKILFDMYYNSKLRRRSVTSIVFTLDKKGIVKIKKNRKTIDISLNENKVYDKFIESCIFKDDTEVYEKIFLKIGKFKNIISSTFDSIIFKDIKEEVCHI